MKYGDLPLSLGIHKIQCSEMMFYQYLPIKMAGATYLKIEPRLEVFKEIIGISCCDFIGRNGLDYYVSSYVYLTAKYLYQQAGYSFNRLGYHSDGFMTDDINYIWCDKDPTVFNTSQYALTQHHEFSLTEMDLQSLQEKEVRYAEYELLRLDQFNIHKVADVKTAGMRAFFKLSISKERYNLIGNSHNYELEYSWEMHPREETRNHPVK